MTQRTVTLTLEIESRDFTKRRYSLSNAMRDAGHAAEAPFRNAGFTITKQANVAIEDEPIPFVDLQYDEEARRQSRPDDTT